MRPRPTFHTHTGCPEIFVCFNNYLPRRSVCVDGVCTCHYKVPITALPAHAPQANTTADTCSEVSHAVSFSQRLAATLLDKAKAPQKPSSKRQVPRVAVCSFSFQPRVSIPFVTLFLWGLYPKQTKHQNHYDSSSTILRNTMYSYCINNSFSAPFSPPPPPLRSHE